jgi:bifunctional DNA-binding transcriptional regulator/antitoxin component of YhaV-PrlF toxin-antitoxin module
MLESMLTIKGQTTAPQPIRDQLRVQADAKLNWHVLPDGAALVRAKNASVADLAGLLQAATAAPPGKNVSR